MMDKTETRVVNAQADEADRLIQELAASKENTENTEQSTLTNQQEEPVEKKVEQEKQPVQPVAKENEQQQEKPVDYEQRYKVLQGKYNSEVPQLRQQIKALTAQLDTVKNQQSNTEQVNKPKAENVQQALSQLQEDFGDAFVNHISALVSNEVGKVNSRVDSLETITAESSHERKCQGLRNILSPLNIDFDALENDADFATWLHQVDEFSNQSRQDLLMSAFNAGDLNRASIFYKKFSESSSQPQSQEQPAALRDENPLEEHVQVSTTPSSGGDELPNSPVWTTAQIDAFYRDVNKGLLTQKEIDMYERQIFIATQNGQVVTSTFN